jgi:hypothetical protein
LPKGSSNCADFASKIDRLAEFALQKALGDSGRSTGRQVYPGSAVRGKPGTGVARGQSRKASDSGEPLQDHNIKTILQELEYICGRGPLDAPLSLLFLDEIQSVPIALATLRYFHEDCPQLPVIAAGPSWNSPWQTIHISMPVGRIEYLFLGPVSFEEFLNASGEDRLLELLREYEPGHPFPQAAHTRLLETPERVSPDGRHARGGAAIPGYRKYR